MFNIGTLKKAINLGWNIGKGLKKFRKETQGQSIFSKAKYLYNQADHATGGGLTRGLYRAASGAVNATKYFSPALHTGLYAAGKIMRKATPKDSKAHKIGRLLTGKELYSSKRAKPEYSNRTNSDFMTRRSAITYNPSNRTGLSNNNLTATMR